MYIRNPGGVPVAPNASRVRGRLGGSRPDPDGWGEFWELAVETAEEVPPLPNFVEPYAGRSIEVHVPPGLPLALQPGDRVEARVAFRGDERGGRFVLQQDDIRRA